MATARITGTGPSEMRILAARLKVAPRRMRTELRNNFTDLADPTVRQVRASILAMGTHGKEHTGLREQVAASVSVSTRFTKDEVRMDIVCDGRKMPAGKDTLPAHLDSEKGWSHPVYPHGPRFRMGPSHARRYRWRPAGLRPLVHRGGWTWTHQEGKPEWFEGPIIAAYPKLRQAAQRAIDAAKRALGA